MKTKIRCFSLALILLATLYFSSPPAWGQGTAFTYQGLLTAGGQAANGSYDMQFGFFNAASGGTQVGATVTNLAVGVTNGLFTVTLNFGPAPFTGQALWLQIAVSPAGSNTYAALSPLQPLTSTPYAVQSLNAATAATVTGGISLSQLPGAVVTNGASNVSITGTFSGNGAGLSTLPSWVLTNDEASAATFAGNVYFSNEVGIGTATPEAPLDVFSDFLPTSLLVDGSSIYGTWMDLRNQGGGANWLVISSGSGNSEGAGNLLFEPGEGPNVTIAGIYPLVLTAQGNVGIGTTNPAASLDVFSPSLSSLLVDGSSTDGTWMDLRNQGGGTNWLVISTGSGNGEGAGNLLFEPGSGLGGADSIYPLVLTAQGNTGIGTATPAAPLDVFSPSYPSLLVDGSSPYGTWMDLRNQGGGTNWLVISTGSGNSEGSGNLLFEPGSGPDNPNYTYPLVLTAQGNVGVGTTNPVAPLDVFNASFPSLLVDGSSIYGTWMDLRNQGGGTNWLVISTGSNNGEGADKLLFEPGSGPGGPNFIYPLVLTAQGNAGIGTTTPETALHVAGPSGSAIRLTGTSGGTGSTVSLDLSTYDPENNTPVASTPAAQIVATEDNWSDDLDIRSKLQGSNTNRLISRLHISANGNVGISNTSPADLLVVGTGGAYCNGTTWVNGSDRNNKQAIRPIDPRAVLEKIAAMPITQWQYKSEAAGVKHIGPMAQDFHAAFGLNGSDDSHITTVDESGVALAAIQGLNQKLSEKDAEIQALKQQNESLEKRLDRLEKLIDSPNRN